MMRPVTPVPMPNAAGRVPPSSPGMFPGVSIGHPTVQTSSQSVATPQAAPLGLPGLASPGGGFLSSLVGGVIDSKGAGGDDLLSAYAAAMNKAKETDAQRSHNPTTSTGSPRKEAKASFDKIVTNLGKMFPNYTRLAKLLLTFKVH